jgi:hypothetical protein
VTTINLDRERLGWGDYGKREAELPWGEVVEDVLAG